MMPHSNITLLCYNRLVRLPFNSLFLLWKRVCAVISASVMCGSSYWVIEHHPLQPICSEFYLLHQTPYLLYFPSPFFLLFWKSNLTSNF